MNGEKEKFAIIDLIASSPNFVLVVEIKRGPLDINEDQLSLYYRLVTFTLQQAKDIRPCFAVFLVYNPELILSSSWLKTPFALYPNIQSLIRNPGKVIDYLKNCAYINPL